MTARALTITVVSLPCLVRKSSCDIVRSSMNRIVIGTAAVLFGLGVAGCAERAPQGGSNVVLPSINRDLVIVAVLPKDTIGEKLPSEGLWSMNSVKWKAELGGFTQETYSQALGFPTNTKLTIHNLSTKYTHTLDVVKVITAPPAVFPKGIKLPIKAEGDGKLAAGYASGPIKPGQSVTVTLTKAGIYLIGCAYHYDLGMHDVLTVGPHAGPGPQATPTPHGGGSGSGSGWGG